MLPHPGSRKGLPTEDILTTAYHLPRERVAKIRTRERRSFLENVAAHREIENEWTGGE